LERRTPQKRAPYRPGLVGTVRDRCRQRSGEHVGHWLAGREPGAAIPVERLSELAHAWYEDRLSPDWRPHTRDGNQATLDLVGLAGDFWRLPG
jgi:hypothetical protein